jgi:hypothetical protein
VSPISAQRFLDLFIQAGGDYYRRADGRFVLRGPESLLSDIAPQIARVGRDAIRAEMERQDRSSSERLAVLLPHRFQSRHGDAA